MIFSALLVLLALKAVNAQLIDVSQCPAGPPANVDPQLISYLKLNGNLEDSSPAANNYYFNQLYYIQPQQSFVQVNPDEPLSLTMEFGCVQSSDQFAPSVPITSSYSKSIFLNVINPSVSFFNTYGSGSLIGGIGSGPNEYHQLVIMDDGVYAWHGQRNTPFRLQAMSQLGNDRSVVPIGNWQHLGLTYNSATQTFSWYLNGTFVASEQTRYSSTWQGSPANQIQIGDSGIISDASNRPMHGTAIKYARIYNGVLSDDQMLSVFEEDLNEFANSSAANQIVSEPTPNTVTGGFATDSSTGSSDTSTGSDSFDTTSATLIPSVAQTQSSSTAGG